MKKEEERRRRWRRTRKEKQRRQSKKIRYFIFYPLSFACFSPISFIIFFSVLLAIYNREQDGEKLRKKFSSLARELCYIRKKRPKRYSFVISGTGPKLVQPLQFAVFMVEPAVFGFWSIFLIFLFFQRTGPDWTPVSGWTGRSGPVFKTILTPNPPPPPQKKKKKSLKTWGLLNLLFHKIFYNKMLCT